MDAAQETRKRWRKEKLVDEIDELMSTSFYKTGLAQSTEDPLRCYLMLVVLLEGLGQFSPGMHTIEVKRKLRKLLGPEKFVLVSEIARQVAERFFKVVKPTYTAASYWSPIDERRHTASHRRKIAKEEEKEMLAYMYAFYALTYAGQEHKYYSVTQYTAVFADRKQGVRVCYRDKIEKSDPNRWWHIPKGQNGSNHRRILRETGLTESVRQHLLINKVSKKMLKQELRTMLANRESGKWSDINSFAENVLAKFPNVISGVSEATLAEARKTRVYINELLGAKLTDAQALFMLMTNLIYDVAFPTNYFYAFPVRIDHLCSIMTIGTSKPLRPFEHSALTRIVTSIFMHPLLLDYAAEKEKVTEEKSRSRESRNRMLLMGGCAHSANNALAMSGFESLTTKFASGEPPDKPLFTLENGNVEEALNSLRAFWVGGKTAQAFIALIEMATHPGVPRQKFLSDQPYTLSECLAEAQRMTKVHLERNPIRLPNNLRIEQHALFRVDAKLPEGYLNKIYIQTLLYELLLNVCKHGAVIKEENTRFAPAQIATRFVDGDLEILITNMLPEDERGRDVLPDTVDISEASGNTFLQFAKVLSDFVTGIKVISGIEEKTFHRAALILSPIQIDTVDGRRWVRAEAIEKRSKWL